MRTNRQGIATIFIVGMLALFLIVFLVVAIDFAYIYTVRGEMQNAADAAALAAAGVMANTPSWNFSTARQAAKDVANANFAGGKSVTLLDEDIVFGFWNGTAFSEVSSPINAVKVSARRIKARENPVGLFFGKTVGWPTMDVVQTAIAIRPPRPTTSLTLCIGVCSTSGIIDFYFNKNDNPACPTGPIPDYHPCLTNTTAWTEFSTIKSTEFGPDSNIAKYIKGELIAPNVCGKSINTNNATTGQIMKILSDELIEQKTASGLPYWDIIVPVFTNAACARGAGYEPDSPFLVEKYARVRLYNAVEQPKPRITAEITGCVQCGTPEEFELMGTRASLVR